MMYIECENDKVHFLLYNVVVTCFVIHSFIGEFCSPVCVSVSRSVSGKTILWGGGNPRNIGRLSEVQAICPA